uniref:Uncharacterized protein n=1 Tax=Phaeomonas parva TaxID=124430 RepID=A0A7S1XSN2_9STRA|mmetsp:Transcript_30511/g.97342  ORF Transcript_30511/g.97342 Transcript_30511/m.97342 type:complete len:757 (+) Transcript_30511:280-2550(+)
MATAGPGDAAAAPEGAAAAPEAEAVAVETVDAAAVPGTSPSAGAGPGPVTLMFAPPADGGVMPPEASEEPLTPRRKSTARTRMMYERSLDKSERMEKLAARVQDIEGCTFKPTLVATHVSRNEKSRSPGDLHREAEEKEKRMERRRESQLQREKQTCTFSPKIKKSPARGGVTTEEGSPRDASERLYSHAQKLNVRKNMQPLASEIDPECTFKPAVKPAPTEGGGPEFLERVSITLSNRTARAHARMEKWEKEALAECTFSPKIKNVRGSRSALPPAEGSPDAVPIYERLHRLHETLAERRARRKAELEREEMAECTFSPDIDKTKRRTSVLALTYADEGMPVHERLYEVADQQRDKHEMRVEHHHRQHSFQPKLVARQSMSQDRVPWELRRLDLFEAGTVRIKDRRESELLSPKRREDEELKHCVFQPKTNWSQGSWKGGLRRISAPEMGTGYTSAPTSPVSRRATSPMLPPSAPRRANSLSPAGSSYSRTGSSSRLAQRGVPALPAPAEEDDDEGVGEQEASAAEQREAPAEEQVEELEEEEALTEEEPVEPAADEAPLECGPMPPQAEGPPTVAAIDTAAVEEGVDEGEEKKGMTRVGSRSSRFGFGSGSPTGRLWKSSSRQSLTVPSPKGGARKVARAPPKVRRVSPGSKTPDISELPPELMSKEDIMSIISDDLEKVAATNDAAAGTSTPQTEVESAEDEETDDRGRRSSRHRRPSGERVAKVVSDIERRESLSSSRPGSRRPSLDLVEAE